MEGHKPHSLEYFPVLIKSKRTIIHYTCNSPKEEILIKNGIKPIGKEFGCISNREVLEIPLNIYKSHGFEITSNKDILQINLENMMRNLK